MFLKLFSMQKKENNAQQASEEWIFVQKNEELETIVDVQLLKKKRIRPRNRNRSKNRNKNKKKIKNSKLNNLKLDTISQPKSNKNRRRNN